MTNRCEPCQWCAPLLPRQNLEPEFDLDSIPDTREGRQQAMEILQGHYFGRDARAIWARVDRSTLAGLSILPNRKTRARMRGMVPDVQPKSFLDRNKRMTHAVVRWSTEASFQITYLTRDEQLAKALEENTTSMISTQNGIQPRFEDPTNSSKDLAVSIQTCRPETQMGL